MAKIKIAESLEQIIHLTPDLRSILIFDKDGVPVASAGDEVRNRSTLVSCFTSLIEQAKKLGMGGQKFWTFFYDSHQVVMLNLEPFAVFFIALPSANTGILCNLKERLDPILKDCEQILHDVVAISS